MKIALLTLIDEVCGLREDANHRYRNEEKIIGGPSFGVEKWTFLL